MSEPQQSYYIPFTSEEDLANLESYLRKHDVFVTASFELDGSIYALGGYLDHLAAGGRQVRATLDRNLLSCIANQAAGKPIRTGDETARIAAAVMAFLSAAHVGFDPSLSLHELAAKSEHEQAMCELSLFRLAEELDPKAFGNLVLKGEGGNESLASGNDSKWLFDRIPEWVLAEARERVIEDTVPAGAFERPLTEWKRHRFALMKIAVLLRQELTGLERMRELLRWSREEAYLDGVACTLALNLFSPKPTGGLLKGSMSPNPQKRLAGVDNAAWDLTYVTIWSQQAEKSDDFWLFCSADKSLRDLARAALGRDGGLQELVFRHWPKKDGELLLQEMSAIDELVESRRGTPHPPGRLEELEAMLDRLIEELTVL